MRSWFGRGYLFIPLVLPLLGMWWLAKHRPAAGAPVERPADAADDPAASGAAVNDAAAANDAAANGTDAT